MSEQEIRQGLETQMDVEVLEIAVTQEVEVPLQELPGEATDYSGDDESCVPCKIKRWQLRKGALMSPAFLWRASTFPQCSAVACSPLRPRVGGLGST